jgi:hypothetical protein
MGPGFDLDRLPANRALFHTVREEEKVAADRAKDHFKRNRPWIADPTLHACATDDEPQSSHPSGHTTMGYAMASILARLMPSRAPGARGGRCAQSIDLRSPLPGRRRGGASLLHDDCGAADGAASFASATPRAAGSCNGQAGTGHMYRGSALRTLVAQMIKEVVRATRPACRCRRSTR